MAMCGGAQATITGDSPNPTGLTIIDQDTVWDGETVSIPSLIVTSSPHVNFTIQNSNITSTDQWTIGQDYPANFVLDNSTITFAPSAYNSYTPLYGYINTTCGFLVPNVLASRGKSTLTFRNSKVCGTSNIYSNGIRILTGCSQGFSENPTYAYARHLLIVDNLTLQYLGGMDSSNNPYFAICGKSPYTYEVENINSYSLSDQRSISFDSDSLIDNLHIVYCGKGVAPTPPVHVINSDSLGGYVSFFGGYYFENITMNNSTEGLYDPYDNGIVKNSWFDANQTKFNIMSCSNVVFENNTLRYASFNIGDGSNEGEGNNNTIRNNSIQFTGASSRKNYTKVLNNNFYYGMPTGGNIPLRVWGNYQIVDGNYIENGEPGLVVAPYYSTVNLYYPIAGNNIIKNNVLTNPLYGITVGDARNTAYNNTFINNSISGASSVGRGAIEVINSTDQYFRDTKITDSNGYDVYLKGSNFNISFLNMYYTPSKIKVDGTDTFNPYYYLDVITESADTNVTDASISVSNTANASNPSKNINLANTSAFITDSSARTPLPSDMSNSGCIISYQQNSTSSENQTYSITASKSGYTAVTLDNINPDTRWYRENPANSKYTIVVDFNESANTHITGFAPSVDENNYKEGESVKFQVWTSEAVDSITWKVNDSIVDENVTTYETTIQENPIVVDISGTDNNGAFSKTWNVIPTANLPNPEFVADVITGTYPLVITFTDQSTDNPTYWKWDFDNDGKIDSTTQNPSCKYKVPGNYTVSLIAGNANGELTKTKTAYITVTGTQPNKKWFFVSWSGWFNNFIRQYFGGT